MMDIPAKPLTKQPGDIEIYWEILELRQIQAHLDNFDWVSRESPDSSTSSPLFISF